MYASSKTLSIEKSIGLRLKSWRLWSPGAKVTLGVILLLAAGCAAMYYADLNKESVFPAAAATIAVGALFVTAYSAFNSSSRMRKKDSLEAWTEWSDSTRAARRRVTDVLGEKNLTMKQGKALLGDGTLVDKDGNDLTEEQCLAVDRDRAMIRTCG